MAYNMVYLGKHSMYTKRMCILLLHGIFYHCQLGQVEWQCYSSFYTFTDVLPTWSIDYWEEGVESANCNCGYDWLFMQFYQFCFMNFKTLIRYIHIYAPNVYVPSVKYLMLHTLMNWTLCHYKMRFTEVLVIWISNFSSNLESF